MIQKIQCAQFEAKKKQTDTDSQKQSQNESLSDNQTTTTQNKNNIKLNRILTYFSFYQQFLKQNFSQIQPHKVESPSNKQIIWLLQQLKEKKINNQICQENSNYTQSLDYKTIKFLQSYQSFHRQKLQQKLLQSGRFKKVDTFTSQLRILNVHPTKHYEIVKLNVQILWYKTQILILNNLQKNPLTSINQASDSGSFGLIYFLKALNQDVAIKCIALQKGKNCQISPLDYKYNSKILSHAIKQYYFLLLFSELQIGPKTKTIGGFDLIVDLDHIQFATEICQPSKTQNQDKFRQDMSQCLYNMHMLKIVHRDIKPSNIMYSPTFKKNVFIDFGCSEGLKQTLGERKVTKFTGATAFCSNQMFDLLTKKFGHVDLYFNDIIALNRSFNFQYVNSSNEIDIIKMKSSIFQVHKMKFYLFEGNYERFYEIWNEVSKQYLDEIDDIQIKLMNFFQDLKLTTQLRQFYWKEIKENIKQMNEFKKLNMLMKNQSFDLLSEIISYPLKEKLFKYFQVLCLIIKVQYGDYTREQIQIQSILMSKEKINEYLNLMQVKFLNQKGVSISKQQRIKLSLIVVFYSTFAQNKYHASVDDKIKACSKAIKILEKDNQSNRKQCIRPISRFLHYFLFNEWKIVPEKYRDKSALNSLITLFIIGDTVNLTALSKLLYVEGNQSIFYQNQKTKKSKKYNNLHQQDINKKLLKIAQPLKDWKHKLSRISMYWQFQLVFILFQKMSTNKNSIKFSMFNYAQYQSQQNQRQWMHNHNQNKVFKVNKIFYQNLIVNYKNFNETSFDKLLAQLKNPQIIQLEQTSYEVKKWRSLMQILLCCFVFVYCHNCAVQILMSLSTKMIFDHWQKDNIFPYAISLFLYNGVNSQTQSQILAKIYDIINQKELGLKFCLSSQINISLNQLDWKGIQNITKLMKKQIKVKNFKIETNLLFISLIRIIKNFIEDYAQSLSIISQQFLMLLKKCYTLVQLGWQVGLNYRKVSSFQKICLTPNQQITTQYIEDIVKKDQLIHQFFSYLLSLGKIYRIASIASENLKNRIEISEKYLKFFKWISINRKVFNFTTQWLKIIKSYPKIKQIMKYNRLFLILFVNFYFQDRRTIGDIEKGQELISDLFERVCPENFYINSNKKNIPSFQVALDFVQIKLIKTKYALNQCENMIQLYKVCVQKNIFSLVFKKKGLLRFIFNSFVYTQKPFQQLWRFLYHLSKNITLLPEKLEIKIITEELQRWFWCLCQNCFPRYPKNWNPLLFIEFLYQKIYLWNPLENPYMSLIYFYSMKKKSLRPEVLRKFIKCILRSVKFLHPIVQRQILGSMYFYVYVGFYAGQRDAIFRSQNINHIEQTIRFPKSQKNLLIHRRLIRSYFMLKKHQENSNEKLQIMAQKGFIKQFYFSDYKYPPLIRKMYKKKLMRYFEVKQNYKKISIIQEILLQKTPHFYNQR